MPIRVELVELKFTVEGDERWSFETRELRFERLLAEFSWITGYNDYAHMPLYGAWAVEVELHALVEAGVDPADVPKLISESLNKPLQGTELIIETYVPGNWIWGIKPHYNKEFQD